jgi:hypothetical protein
MTFSDSNFKQLEKASMSETPTEPLEVKSLEVKPLEVVFPDG